MGVLVHICCSVDSSYYLRKLQEELPGEELVGFFYDPNIHPYSEYYLRMIDARRSCERLGIAFVEGEYDVAGWLEAVRGFETEPEKGKRCTVCFDNRLETSAKEAQKRGLDKVTTTLLMSPKKDLTTLERVSLSLQKRYGLEFFVKDFRKNGGTQAQFALSKEEQNYHQNYCGCLFALHDQREQQERVCSELMSPVGGEVLPGSIDERVALYEKRMVLEASGIPYKITRERFRNYRLLEGWVKLKGQVIPAFFLPDAKVGRTRQKLKIEWSHEDQAHANRDGIRFVTLERLNQTINSTYTSVAELMANPPEYDRQIEARETLTQSRGGLSPVIVVDRLFEGGFEIHLVTRFYEDTREFLVALR